MQRVFYFIICFMATTLGAISGVGGGVIIKPVMDAVSGLSVSVISFLSGCTVLTMTVVSLLKNKKEEIEIDVRRTGALAFGGMLGGILGKTVFEHMILVFSNDNTVGMVQNMLMVALTLGVLVYMLKKDRIKTKNVQNIAVCFIIGLLLGIVSSFLGIGGGPINLIVLYYFFSMETKNAALNSLYIIFFSQFSSLGSTLLKNEVPNFSNTLLLIMITGGMIGGFLGRDIAKKISDETTNRLFLIIVICILLASLYNVYRLGFI